jgi:hypothetical protein
MIYFPTTVPVNKPRSGEKLKQFSIGNKFGNSMTIVGNLNISMIIRVIIFISRLTYGNVAGTIFHYMTTTCGNIQYLKCLNKYVYDCS